MCRRWRYAFFRDECAVFKIIREVFIFMEWFQLGMAGLQGLSGVMKGGAERMAGRQARQTSYYNAAAMERAAEEMGAESAENQMRLRAMQGVAVGQAAARTAASGVERSGSALGKEMAVATRFEQEVNDLAARDLQQVSAMRGKAQMERWKGRQAERAAKRSGFGSLLGGVMQGGVTAFNAFQ